MAPRRNRFRHLPPTAVPVTMSDLSAGLRSSPNALEQFRADLAAYLDITPEACQLASSGRTALYCLLQGLKLERTSRTQVIIPAYTCPAVARVAIDLDLHPTFVDLSPKTLCYNYEQLAAAVGENTLAVVLVHPFGIPLPVDDILALTHDAGAVVIEDAAQAMGARWNGRPAGTRGDFGLFSLGPGKPISTGGGGIATANHANAIPTLHHGWAQLPVQGAFGSAQAWMRLAAFQLAFHPRGWWAATRAGLHRIGNHEASWGYSVTNLTPAQARTGRALLPRLDEINAQRQRHAEKLTQALKQSTSIQSISISESADPIYLRFPLIAESKRQREQLFKEFWAAGIGAGRLYEATLPSIYAVDGVGRGQDAILSYGDKQEATSYGSFPGAEAVAGRLLTLPTHHYVTDNDLQIMSRILEES